MNIILIISFFYSLEDCPAQPISDFDKDLRESSIQRRSINHSIRSYPGRRIQIRGEEVDESAEEINFCLGYIIGMYVGVCLFGCLGV